MIVDALSNLRIAHQNQRLPPRVCRAPHQFHEYQVCNPINKMIILPRFPHWFFFACSWFRDRDVGHILHPRTYLTYHILVVVRYRVFTGRSHSFDWLWGCERSGVWIERIIDGCGYRWPHLQHISHIRIVVSCDAFTKHIGADPCKWRTEARPVSKEQIAFRSQWQWYSSSDE